MNEADRQLIREALDLGKYYAEEVHQHADCPYFDAALAILDADKPTVPMAMLKEISDDGEYTHPDSELRIIAARYGYEVTE